MRNFLASCRNNDSSTMILAIALGYAPFLLGMQYSKHKWVIVQPETLWGYVPILHAEMILYVMIVALLILGIRSTLWAYLILTLYYVVCFLDNVVWFAFMRPFHPEDVMRGIELMKYYREFVTVDSVSWKMLVYMAVPPTIGVITLLYGWKSGLLVMKQRLPVFSRLTDCLGRTILAGTSVAMVGYAILMPLVISPSYLHFNSLFRIGEEIYHEQLIARGKMLPSDKKRLLGSSSSRTGNEKSKRYNVIFYVIETAPNAIYPDMSPLFNKWAERNGGSVRIMAEHYTTYPESDRSLLSMMSGNYPCLSRGSGWIETYDYGKPLPQVLKQNGYQTHLFSTAPLGFHQNDVLVQKLGFSNSTDSSVAKEAYAQARVKKDPLNRTSLYKADETLLEQALDTIRAQGDHPYLLAFLPQASHAPFQTPPGYTGGKSQRELFDANARWQMGLIDRIMKCLDETEQAQKTILIVLGDHGLRHPAESSLFRNQTMLNPLTFGVTFAGYFPQQLPSMQPSITSHIDITPTVLEMLSIPYDSEDYQGRSMLTATSRTVFFLGGDYLPVSGFTRNGNYFMENRNRNLILKSPKFDFHNAEATHIEVVSNKEERASINRDLSLLKSLLTF